MDVYVYMCVPGQTLKWENTIPCLIFSHKRKEWDSKAIKTIFKEYLIRVMESSKIIKYCVEWNCRYKILKETKRLFNYIKWNIYLAKVSFILEENIKIATKWITKKSYWSHKSSLNNISLSFQLNYIITFSDNTIFIVSHFTVYIIFSHLSD